MSDKQETAAQRYKRLRANAADLRKMANEDTAAGPTYWNNMRKCTGVAIADCNPGRPEGVTWAMSPEQMRAIWHAADLAPIWKAAAEVLDREAEAMVEELKKQAAEAAALASELEESKE